MKQDKDLVFLATCPNDELRTLCDILTYNKKGEIRLGEQLTNTDAYINYYPERMSLMATEIGEELRKYGSNTIKTICRKGEAFYGLLWQGEFLYLQICYDIRYSFIKQLGIDLLSHLDGGMPTYLPDYF